MSQSEKLSWLLTPQDRLAQMSEEEVRRLDETIDERLATGGARAYAEPIRDSEVDRVHSRDTGIQIARLMQRNEEARKAEESTIRFEEV